MTATNTILEFDATQNNILSDAAYASSSGRTAGNQPGIASSQLNNKALRQASLMAAGLAQFIANYQANNIGDTLTAANIAAYLTAAMMNGFGAYLTDTGSANAYAVATPSGFTTQDGSVLMFKVAHTNTGTSTLNVNGTGAVAITGEGNIALQGGELSTAGICTVVYNASAAAWQMLGCTGGASQVAPATNTQHAPQLQQVLGSHRLYNVTGSVSGGTFAIGCDAFVARNPSNGNTIYVGGGPAATNNIGTSGPIANGRDSATAFVIYQDVHFYWIWGAGVGAATISSANAPLAGPVLPSGYTHWCYVATVRANGASSMPLAYLRGNQIGFGTQIAVLSGGGAASTTAVGVSTCVPLIAPTYDINVVQVACTSSSGGGAAMSSSIVLSGVVQSTGMNSTGAASSLTSVGGPVVRLVNLSQTYYYYAAITAGAGPSVSHAVTGYTVPNGA